MSEANGAASLDKKDFTILALRQQRDEANNRLADVIAEASEKVAVLQQQNKALQEQMRSLLRAKTGGLEEVQRPTEVAA